MDKKTIKLTESDIENIVKKVITEQKKRKVKTEESVNWKGKDSGNLNFKIYDLTPLAYNVTKNKYQVRQTTKVSKGGGVIPPEITPDIPSMTIPTYEIIGDSLPYADNMVKPYFNKYLNAKKEFIGIVNLFSKYIKAGGGDKLTNVTIKGSADSGRPTLQWPSGYSELDHPSAKPYNGKTDPKEMNQYLADMRANLYAQALINSVKELTGFDLKINVLKGDNFYGQGEGKRGIEFRKITLTPNADKLRVPEKSIESGTSTPGQLVKNGGIPYLVDVYLEGQTENMKGYRVMDSKGYKRLGISRELTEKLDLPKFEGKVSSEVKGEDFYANGKLVGKIKTMNESPVNMSGKPRYFAGPISTVAAYRTHKINGEDVTISYLKDAYFAFF